MLYYNLIDFRHFMCVGVCNCHHAFIVQLSLIIVLSIIKLIINSRTHLFTKLQKGGHMTPVKLFLFQLRKFFSATTFVSFLETLWAIGCSVVAGIIPA